MDKETKSNVRQNTNSVLESCGNITKYVTAKNYRMVNKLIPELKENRKNLNESIIKAEVEGVDSEQDFMKNAKEQTEKSMIVLNEGVEFLLDYEESETNRKNLKLNTAKLKDLTDSLNSFIDWVKTEDNIDESKGMERLKNLREEKIKLSCELEETDQSKLSTLFCQAEKEADEWVRKLQKSNSSEKIKETEGIKKKPGLKLDRLSVPTFSGNMRAYAKFKREFENTVALEFPDPQVQLLYLQNQCLQGQAKDCVRNLTDFDSAMSRLDERYGRHKLIIESVNKEIFYKKLPEEESARIIQLYNMLEEAWDDVEAIKATDEFCNILTLGAIESKLSPRVQLIWAEKKDNSKSSRVLMTEIKNFIKQQKEIAEEAMTMRSSVLGASAGQRFKAYGNVNNVDVAAGGSRPRKCYRCGNDNHLVRDCTVPPTIVCRRCGRRGHIERACNHNDGDQITQANMNVNEHGTENLNDPTVGNCNTNLNSVRLPVETVNTQWGNCTTLWDTGSAVNLVSESWINAKGIKGKKCKLKYKVVDGASTELDSHLYEINLVDANGETHTIAAYGIKHLSSSAWPVNDETLDKIRQETEIDSSLIDTSVGAVHLLIGSGCLKMFPETVHKTQEFCVMQSKFGVKPYLIAGGTQSQPHKNAPVYNTEYVHIHPMFEVCNTMVKQAEELKFMSGEDLGIRPAPICKTCKNCEICKPAAQFLTLRDHMELNVIKNNLTYDVKAKRWSASYPFLKEPSVLLNNYEAAVQVLKRRERKLIKDGNAMMYNDQIKDFVARGVIRQLKQEEMENWTGPVRYVDHREVYKEGATTPLRIVINSSFKRGNELSLNDILMKGPNVLTHIFDVLCRWRMYPVAIIGDISKMYHNVGTGEMERHLRRMLWRECDQTKDPDTYCFEVVTFGDRPAGCIVVSALKATANMFSFIAPRAAEVITTDTYMDDLVTGANSEKEAKELVTQVEEIAGRGGFKFKKFVMSKAEGEDGENETEKILGVPWKPKDDTLKVKVDLNHNKKIRGQREKPIRLEAIPYTRRVCLRLVNGVFDPLGMFAAVTVRMKMLMKKHFVASDKYKKWDKPLEAEDCLEWERLLKDIQRLSDIAIPRHVGMKEAARTMLVCYADASKEAMCCAVYIRSEDKNGMVKVQLIASKTKVTPIKAETIPRLELCAALFGARLSEKVFMSINNQSMADDGNETTVQNTIHDRYMILDSKITLGSLNKGDLSNSFNGHCIAEIRSKTEKTTFAWVQSDQNIADLGSRGTVPAKVSEDSTWQRGPDWLQEPVEKWPIEIQKLEELPSILNMDTRESLVDCEKYSNLHQLHKVTALCLKFVKNMKEKQKKTQLCTNYKEIRLSPLDYKEAETYWLKQVSLSTLDLLESGKLRSLRPIKVWDAENNHIKVMTSGRLGKLLKVGYDVEELQILDPKHHYSRLILKEIHEQCHESDDKVIWKSRNRFWIPKARRVVSRIRQECYKCRLLQKKLCEQMMAPLPGTRVLPSPAWTYTSIDLFGPLEHADMVRKRLKEKCWGVIFTCCVSRAVHIDLTQAYHTDALIQTIRRFMSLRGCPKEILSDQGTQLVACHKELAVMLELMDWSLIDGWCSRRGVEWKFVPPQGQHMNGVSEALVKVTKRQLTQAVEGKMLNFVETQTVFCEISQVMNCRPLGVYARPGADPLDGGPITPNHLLLGRATNQIPELKFENVSLIRRMRFLQGIIEEFWHKWKIVSFPSLVPQYKWHKKCRNAAVGDVVLLNSDDSKVAEFKLGQITEVFESSDKLVRSATVRFINRTNDKVSTQHLKRPIHKLCVIVPVEEQQSV